MRASICDPCFYRLKAFSEAKSSLTLNLGPKRVRGDLCKFHVDEIERILKERKSKGLTDNLQFYELWLMNLDKGVTVTAVTKPVEAPKA